MRPRTASKGLLLDVQASRDRSSRLARAMGATLPAWRACSTFVEYRTAMFRVSRYALGGGEPECKPDCGVCYRAKPECLGSCSCNAWVPWQLLQRVI